MELQLEAHKAALELYQMSMGTYQSTKIEVVGIDNLRSFDQKYPAQISDVDDPISAYSSLYANSAMNKESQEKLRAIKVGANSQSENFVTYVQRKNFIDVKTNHKWRVASFRQQELVEVSDTNIVNSTMVERVSEDDIVEQASMVVGNYPYRPEFEEDIIDWINVINKKGKNRLWSNDQK